MKVCAEKVMVLGFVTSAIRAHKRNTIMRTVIGVQMDMDVEMTVP